MVAKKKPSKKKDGKSKKAELTTSKTTTGKNTKNSTKQTVTKKGKEQKSDLEQKQENVIKVEESIKQSVVESKTAKEDLIGKEKQKQESIIYLHICKRERYIEAWKAMYALDKKKWNDPMFDGINPMLNKLPLSTEVNNFCVVAYSKLSKDGDKNLFENPIGIFCMVVTERNTNVKVIGKQYLVDPDFQGKGIGKAMLLVLERELKKNGYNQYYIGCSKMSSRILESFGNTPYESDDRGDLYKFNVTLKPDDEFDKIYNNAINNDKFSVIS